MGISLSTLHFVFCQYLFPLIYFSPPISRGNNEALGDNGIIEKAGGKSRELVRETKAGKQKKKTG